MFLLTLLSHAPLKLSRWNYKDTAPSCLRAENIEGVRRMQKFFFHNFERLFFLTVLLIKNKKKKKKLERKLDCSSRFISGYVLTLLWRAGHRSRAHLSCLTVSQLVAGLILFTGCFYFPVKPAVVQQSCGCGSERPRRQSLETAGWLWYVISVSSTNTRTKPIRDIAFVWALVFFFFCLHLFKSRCRRPGLLWLWHMCFDWGVQAQDSMFYIDAIKWRLQTKCFR